MICRLCLEEDELRNSHIIPEFLYSELYNDKRQLMGINGLGKRGWRPLQKGLREYLFCEKCEQHFNEYCEKPFRTQWVENCPMPKSWDGIDAVSVNVTYGSFKLLHLSILFRASVSTLATFSDVSLGPHQEVIRKMILEKNAGESWRYPIVGNAVIHHRNNTVVPMVTKPAHYMYESRYRCYGTVYGGVHWLIGVAGHRNAAFEELSLKESGDLRLYPVKWNEISQVRDAAIALRTSHP